MGIRSQLMHAATDFSRLTELLDSLMLDTGSDAVLFRCLDLTDFSYPVTLVRGNDLFTKAFFGEYDGGMVLSDPQLRFALERSLRPGTVYVCHEHYPPNERKKDPYFSDFLPRHNIKWFAGYLVQTAHHGVGFGIARAPDKPHYTSRDKKVLQTLTPEFEEWCQLFVDHQRQKLIVAATEVALEKKYQIAACIDGQCRVLWRNQRADDAIDSMKDISIRNDRLIVNDDSEASPLFNALSDFTKTGPGHAPFMTRYQQVQSTDGRNFGLTLQHVSAETGEYTTAAFQGYALLIDERTVKPRHSGQQLGSISALSPTELSVAELTSSGMTVSEIALEKNVAPSTINTHKKRIYKKLGINSKQELATLYTEFRLQSSTMI